MVGQDFFKNDCASYSVLEIVFEMYQRTRPMSLPKQNQAIQTIIGDVSNRVFFDTLAARGYRASTNEQVKMWST
jgi:hypothetical protein